MSRVSGMSRPLKIAIYAALVACLITFGLLAARGYNRTRAARAHAAATNNAVDVPLAAPQVKSADGSSWALLGALALAALLTLALMFARDVSHMFANRVDEFIFNDDLK